MLSRSSEPDIPDPVLRPGQASFAMDVCVVTVRAGAETWLRPVLLHSLPPASVARPWPAHHCPSHQPGFLLRPSQAPVPLSRPAWVFLPQAAFLTHRKSQLGISFLKLLELLSITTLAPLLGLRAVHSPGLKEGLNFTHRSR